MNFLILSFVRWVQISQDYFNSSFYSIQIQIQNEMK